MAGANLGTAWIQVKPSMDGVRGSILSNLKGSGTQAGQQMGSEIGKSGGLNAGMAVLWGAASGIAFKAIDSISSKLTQSIGGAIQRIDTLNNSNRTFANMGFSAEDSAKAIKGLEKSIKGLPTPLDSAMRGMTALAATYGDVGFGQKVFSSLNNAILGFGGSAAQVENAITQISQLPLDGPLDAQTWNSLRNSGLTPVLVAMSKEFGMSVSEMKKAFGDGEMTVQQFMDKLVEMNEKGGGGLKSLTQIAQDSTAGIATAMANNQTAITRGVAAIINAIGPANISGAITKSGESMEKALKGVADALIWIKDNSDIAIAGVLGLSSAMTVSLIPSIMKAIPPMKLWGTYAQLAGLRVAGIGSAMAGFARSAFLPAIIGSIVAALAMFVISSGGFGNAANKVGEIFDNITKVIQDVAAQLPTIISTIAAKIPTIINSIVQAIVTGAPALFTAAVAMIDALMNGLINNGPKIISALSEIIDKMVSGLTQNIDKFATSGTEIIVKLIESITNNLPSVISAAVTIINKLADGFAQALPTIIQAGIDIIMKLIEAITNNLPAIIATAITIITALLTGLLTALPLIINAAVQLITALMTALINNLPLIINAAIQLITTLVTALIQNLPMLINAAITIVFALVNGLIQALPQLINGAAQLIGGLVAAIISNLPLILGAAVTIIAVLVKGLIQMIPQLVVAAFQLIGALVGALLGMVGQLLSAGGQLIMALIRGIGGLLGNVGRAAGEIGNSILNTLKGINLLDVGSNLIKGLWDGISNMAGWIKDKISGFGEDVMNSLKSFFGIESPSRLVRDEVGKFIGQGLGIGIEQSTKNAVAAAQQQAKSVMAAYAGMSAPAFGFTSNGALADGMALAGTSYQFNITNPSPEETASIIESRIRANGGNI